VNAWLRARQGHDCSRTRPFQLPECPSCLIEDPASTSSVTSGSGRTGKCGPPEGARAEDNRSSAWVHRQGLEPEPADLGTSATGRGGTRRLALSADAAQLQASARSAWARRTLRLRHGSQAMTGAVSRAARPGPGITHMPMSIRGTVDGQPSRSRALAIWLHPARGCRSSLQFSHGELFELRS
jgi:hypothetical protein